MSLEQMVIHNESYALDIFVLLLKCRLNNVPATFSFFKQFPASSDQTRLVDPFHYGLILYKTVLWRQGRNKYYLATLYLLQRLLKNLQT